MSSTRPQFSICPNTSEGNQFVCDALKCPGNIGCLYQEQKMKSKNPIGTGHPEELQEDIRKRDIPQFLRQSIGTETADVLTDARRIIYGDREKTYGSPDRNLQTIADFWFDYLKSKYPQGHPPITVDDVCYMMVLLKVARLVNDPQHRDSMLDGCGYFALAERVQKFHADKKTKE